MTWVDGVVIGVVLISALLGVLRGFVREILGVGAWVGAAAAAVFGYPILAPYLRELSFIPPDFADLIAIALIALVVLFLLSMIAATIGRAVQGSAAGGVDRTLGLAFGLARGVLLVIVAYVAGGWLTTADRWPEAVRQARSGPYVADAAAWVANLLPPDLRPRINPWPAGPIPTSAQLLQAPTRRGL
jgi:membrane protein required for colicin V production